MPSEHQKLQIMQKTALVLLNDKHPIILLHFSSEIPLSYTRTCTHTLSRNKLTTFCFSTHSLYSTHCSLNCSVTTQLSCFPTPYKPSIPVRSGNGRVVLPSGCWWTGPGKPSGPAALGGWGRGRSGAGAAAGWTLQHNIGRCTVKGRCIVSKGSLLQSNVTTFKRANAIIKSRQKSKWLHQQWHHDAVKISR